MYLLPPPLEIVRDLQMLMHLNQGDKNHDSFKNIKK